MATASAHGVGHNYAENVIKQGYLKKSVQTSELVTSTAKQIKTNIKQKLEPVRWYVFGVRNRIPYLEYFDKEESVFTGQALETYDLSTFKRLSYTMGKHMPSYSFCIYLEEEMVDLTAANRVQMIEWCRTLERHLANLGFKVKRAGKDDHTYIEFPIKRPTRHTGLEAERLMQERELAEAGGLADDMFEDDYEDEEKENEYEDIVDKMIEKKDENDNNKDPHAPKRPPKAHHTEDDDPYNVFESLYSVKRDSLTPPASCNSREDFVPWDIANYEDTLTDYLKESQKGNTLKALNKYQGMENFDDEGNIRCSSLPIMPLEGAGSTGDTSEDNDFIGASFWLRNRKTQDLMLLDEIDPETARRKLPPQPSERGLGPPPVPTKRADSMRGRSTGLCMSMNEKMLLSSTQTQRGHSPTLDTLGQAPVPQIRGANRSSPEVHKKDLLDGGENMEDNQLIRLSPELPKRILPKNKDIGEKPGKQENGFTIKHVSKLEQGGCGYLDEDEVGDYESVKCRKQDGLVNGVESGEGIYEPAWMGSSHRDESPDKKGLFVDMGTDTTECSKNNKDAVKANTTVKSEKLEKRFSFKRFSRKKKRDLPNELSVTIDGRHSSGDYSSDGNLYSDLPTEAPKLSPKTPEAANSDLCKISLENGPSRSVDSSPVLPRRNNNMGQNSRSSMFLRFEDMDPPCPPRKTGVKGQDDSDVVMRHNGEIPVAPPRRNRKTIHGSVSYSSEAGKHKTVINNFSQGTDGKVPQPRRGLPPLPSDEPTLFPRDIKPALPPPRRNEEGNCIKPDVPSRLSTRPKSMNITKRQLSTETAPLTVMNLKQNQVDILRSEIDMYNGILRTISKAQFQSGLALVECFDRVWIAGWALKNFPRLYDKFHIGDQLIAINDVHVTEVDFAMKLVKNVKADTIDVMIRRLPIARVFGLQRSMEGQNLGFKRDGGTAEIAYVDPHGVAAAHGLPAKASTVDFSCNWWLTEINMRPLNLFFKDKEIEHRLLAVGRDISIVVQPADFIKELRKQLKKVKGYKDYLVQ